MRTAGARAVVPDAVGLAIALLVMLAGGWLAYRLPAHFFLGVGDGPDAGYDGPYLQGFNLEPEHVAGTTGGFRWAFGDAAVQVPGLGRASYLWTMQLVNGRPGPSVSRWRLADKPLVNVVLATVPRQYHVLLPQDGDDLRVAMVTPAFHAGSDRRDLAMAVDRIAVASIGPVNPAWRELAGCGLLIGLLFALLRQWRVPAGTATPVAAGTALGLAALLVWQRTVLTAATPRWVVVLVTALPLFWVVRWCLLRLAGRLAPRAMPQAHGIAALVVLAWLVRTLALVHPQAITSDAGLHIHNLQNVAGGKVIFTEDLPGRAGGGQSPYPAGGYLALLPAMLLVPVAHLMAPGSALIDSVVIGGLWLLCALVDVPAPAALFAGGLYLFAGPALLALSIGEMANVWAQALTLPLAVALLGRHSGRVGAAAFAAWATVALLGHFGVFLSLLAFGGVYGLLLLAGRERSTLRTLQLLLVSVLVAIALYYLVWMSIIVGRVPVGVQAADSVRPTLQTSLRLIWQQLRGLGGLRDVGALPVLAGLVGIGLLWQGQRSLARLAAAWWLAALLSLAPLLWSLQALRWQLWLCAMAALCGGVALGTLWRRGKPGRLVALLVLLAWCARGAGLWVTQIASYKH